MSKQASTHGKHKKTSNTNENTDKGPFGLKFIEENEKEVIFLKVFVETLEPVLTLKLNP